MNQGWPTVLTEAAKGAVVLFGPGADDTLPPGMQRRHLPFGRSLPLAEGARIANPERPVLVVTGDGDLYGHSLGDLLHAVRRNTGITCIVMDNGVAAGGVARNAAWEYSLRPLPLLLSVGATFLAQVWSDDENLVGVIRDAQAHEGFALVILRDGLKPDERIDLDQDPQYDQHNRGQALERAANVDGTCTGILYHEPERKSYEEAALPGGALSTGDALDMSTWERLLADLQVEQKGEI